MSLVLQHEEIGKMYGENHNCDKDGCDPETRAQHDLDDLHDRIHVCHMQLDKLYEEEFDGSECANFDYFAHNMKIIVEAARLAGLRALIPDRMDKLIEAEQAPKKAVLHVIQ